MMLQLSLAFSLTPKKKKPTLFIPYLSSLSQQSGQFQLLIICFAGVYTGTTM